MITPHHIEQTHQFMTALAATCRDRRLPLPAIREVQLAQRHGRTFSFAIFPDTVGGKLEAYQQAGFLHQLSTTLKGQPVTYSNHTGFRLVALIEDAREALPARLDYPDHLSGFARLGRDESNREVCLPWSQFGHGLIVGMPGSGKSSELRALVCAALRDDLLLVLADLHDNTFPMLNGHPNLLAPIAHTVVEFIERMQVIREVIEQRKASFQAMHAQNLYPADHGHPLKPPDERPVRIIGPEIRLHSSEPELLAFFAQYKPRQYAPRDQARDPGRAQRRRA